MCMALTIERAYVSLCISRLAAQRGTVKTEGLFATDNMLTTQRNEQETLFVGCFAYGGGRRASLFWFSGNKFFTPFHVLSESMYSVMHSFLISALSRELGGALS